MQKFIRVHTCILAGILLLAFAESLSAQTPSPLAPPPIRPAMLAPEPTPPTQVRTYYFTSLSNVEVENYLQYNDLIFIPIANVQAHGVLPVDCEYVAAEALARTAAQKSATATHSSCVERSSSNRIRVSPSHNLFICRVVGAVLFYKPVD